MAAIDAFRHAVEHADAHALRAVLKTDDARRSINDTIFAFDAPAIVAVAGKDVALTDVLLEFGADPNARSTWWAGGFHALYSATPAVAERLLAAGAVPDACAAAHLDRIDLMTEMIDHDPGRVHERGGDGQTPLHFARSREVADLLLARGADIDARDVDHRSTAAEWMIGGYGARVPLARYLVQRGATADVFLAAALGLVDRIRALIGTDLGVLSLRTTQGRYGEQPPSSYHIYMWTLGANLTPIQVASKFGQRDAVNAMRETANPTQHLLLACHEGDRDAAFAIVAANPGLVASLAPADTRALADEAWLPNPPAVALMLELGFDPSLPSASGTDGGTALHCAAWQGSAEAVAAILRYPSGRALLDVRDPTHGGTPLGWCSHGSQNCGNPLANHAKVEQLLRGAGANR